MSDWKKLVGERLVSLTVPHSAKQEIVSELASHFEEICDAAQAQGLTEALAVERALQEIDDWRVLAAKIRAAKLKEDPVNDRTKTLWLPGAATLFGASTLLALIQFAGIRPRLISIAGTGMLFYWPWLAGLPIVGAMGAYLSRRAQGPISARLIAGLFPVLAMLITMSLILPWGLAVDGLSFLRLVYLGIGVTNWVMVPGAALLVGALPFLRDHNRAKPAQA
jgi:hypothetical protein